MGIIHYYGVKKMYKIKLPNKRKPIRLWFIGPQLEEILKAYNIEYKVEKSKR